MEYTTRTSDTRVANAQAISDPSIAPGVSFLGDSDHRKTGVVAWLKELDYISMSIGLIYLWFGALKFFPLISPAEELATNTVVALSFSILPASVAIILLAIMEVGIGIGLIFFQGRKFWIKVALFHMFCTFTPLLLFPGLSFGEAPLQLTLVGQYILKNVVIVAVLFHLLRKRSA